MADDDNDVDLELDDEPELEDGPEGEGAEGEDTGEGDDEPEGSAERTDAPPGADDGPQRGDQGQGPVGRGSRRFQALLRERAQTKRELEALRRQTQELQRAQFQSRQSETEAQRNARLAVMTPEERNAYEWQEWQQGVNRTLQGYQLQGAMELDRIKFEAKADRNPLYARYADRVEEVFNSRLQQGLPMAQREVILKFLIGEDAMKGASGSTRKAKAAGQKKIEAQRAASGSSKGDASSSRGRRGESAEDRLKNVEI